MSGYTSFASAGGANQNLNNTYEALGFAANGTMTQFTAGTANALGSYASLGTTASAYAGFYLYAGVSGNSAHRYMITVSLDGGSTVFVPELYCEPTTSGGFQRVFIPLNIPAGTTVSIALRCSTTSGTLFVGIEGIVSNSQSPPLFTSMTALNLDTANTRANNTDIAFQSSGSTTFATLVASTAAQYGALLLIPGSSTATVTAQNGSLRIATGAAASETEIERFAFGTATTTFAMPRVTFPLIEKTVASSTRLSAQYLVNTAGTDALRLAVYGFA